LIGSADLTSNAQRSRLLRVGMEWLEGRKDTVPMLVEESRILQVSIFTILHRSLPTLDSSRVLLDVIEIADEVDSQLKQSTLCYV
jgi:hypothetical protein